MKRFAVSLAVAMTALTIAPTAHADMLYSNYSVNSDRDPGHFWVWSINPCFPNQPGCLQIYATPQPNGQATVYRERPTCPTAATPWPSTCPMVCAAWSSSFPRMMFTRGMR